MWIANWVSRLFYTSVKPRGSLDKGPSEAPAGVDKGAKIKVTASARHQTPILWSFIPQPNQYTETLYSSYWTDVPAVFIRVFPISVACSKVLFLSKENVDMQRTCSMYIRSCYSVHKLKIIWRLQWNGVYKFLYFLSLFLPKCMMYNYKELAFCYGRATQTLWTLSIQRLYYAFLY